MGWNSWDCYGTTVTEAEVLANAGVLAERLRPAGWDTVVVDIDWYDPTARAHGYTERAPIVLDGGGRQLPAPERFPSAAGGRGFGPLAASVHALGLRFGLHLLSGIPRLAVERDLPVHGTPWTARDAADTSVTCTWNPHNHGLDHAHPAAQAYLDGLVAQLASWGVDLVKLDDVLSPYRDAEIEAWARAIERSGRDILLSLSPGTGLSTVHLDHLRRHATMWRISDDLWDRWPDVHAQFARLARWAPLQRPGGWADADMLPLGRIGLRAERGEPRDSLLTLDEQRTLLTLWTMARSPLMIGGDLPSSREDTLRLLADPALGRVLRSSRDGREILREPDADGELIVWTARAVPEPDVAGPGATPDDGPGAYVALFWTGSGTHRAVVPVQSVLGLGTAPSGPPGWTARDLWAGTPPGAGPARRHEGPIAVDVPSHGVVWLLLTPSPR